MATPLVVDRMAAVKRSASDWFKLERKPRQTLTAAPPVIPCEQAATAEPGNWSNPKRCARGALKST